MKRNDEFMTEDEKYITEDEKYTEESMNEYSIAFLMDILFNPHIEDKKFNNDTTACIYKSTLHNKSSDRRKTAGQTTEKCSF